MPPTSSVTGATDASALPPISSLIRLEAKTHPEVHGEVDSKCTEILHKTRWLQLERISYNTVHRTSTSHKWDMVTRSTRQPNSSGADAVAVLATLRLADDVPRILLVKQFRPPLNGVTIELPAGLIDAGETVEEAALRELREETGFTGSITKVHAAAPLSPGLTNEAVILVQVDVHPEKKQAQQLEQSENVHVISVPVNRMLEALQHIEKEEGVHVMHAVTAMAAGISMAFSSWSS